MHCLANMCYVCLEKKNEPISNINSSLAVNKDIIHIISYLPFDLAWLKTKRVILICEECCLRLRETYQFRAMCLKNSALLQRYTNNLNTSTAVNTENEAELTVTLDVYNKHKNTNEVKSEIKLEEMYTDECGPIIKETEHVYVNIEDCFVKEEYTCKREEVDDKEEHPIDNNSTAITDNELNSEIPVNTDADTADTDSVNSGFTCKQLHATNKKKTAKKSYTCLTCGKSFTRKLYLTRHKRIHTTEKRFKCNRCEKCFKQQSILEVHMRVHTGEKPYKCSRCEKCFSQKSNLVCHMRVHTNEKPFKCSTCDKCFAHRINLKQHMLIHTGEKPYKCSRCEKCVSKKSNLVYHMQKHTNEKPYKCSDCSKCFKSKLDLSKHMQVHTSEKPFKCSICEKCFARPMYLKQHMLIHTGVKNVSPHN